MEHLLRAEQLVLYKLYLTYNLYYDIASKSSVDRHREAEANAPRPGEGGRIMEFGMFVSWMVVGLLAGWLAGVVMKGGGYGLVGDLGLGLVGSVVGGWIFTALGVSAGGGLFPTVFVAFVGAVIVIVAQRKVWAHA
jgi:uncharacterized membrane protein YeaQ/YmgE (transglycosylase-associated protein family)